MRKKIQARLWKWTLFRLRAIVDVADEWIHAQEVSLRDAAARPEFLAEVDPVASSAREKAIKKARVRKAQPKRPRLVYQAGQFVRREA